MSGVDVGGVHYNVTLEYLNKAKSDVQHMVDTMDGRLAEIKSLVMSIESHWQGVAANTFQELMEEWNVYGNMLKNSLQDIGLGLNGTYVNYHDAEQTAVNNLKQIESHLPGGYQTTPDGAANLNLS